MVVQPAGPWPAKGFVLNNTRYVLHYAGAVGQQQFYANSRGTLRFLAMNHSARQSAQRWARFNPGVQAQWNAFNQVAFAWNSTRHFCEWRGGYPYA